MAGVRLGYAICRDAAFLGEMSRRGQCWNVSTIAQSAGIAALDCGAWLAESVGYISAERGHLENSLAALGASVFPGEANYIMFKTVPDLAERLMDKGIMIRGCANYAGLGKGYYRVAVRKRAENDILLAAVKEALK